MKMVKNLIATATGMILLWAVSALAATELKLGYPLGPTSHVGVGASTFAAEVVQRTGGRFVIEQFPNLALGGEREMVEGAQIGSVDLVITSTGPVGNFAEETLIFDIPFLFRDYPHARAVLDGPIGQAILDHLANRGLIGLAWGENGFRHLTNNLRPVTRPADLHGMKLRTMQNDVHIEAFAALGALPTPMAFTEVFTALQQGTVDAQEGSIPVIVSGRFSEVQRYLSLTRHVYSPALFIMSPTVWDDLSEADRRIFVEAARTAARAMRDEVTRVEQSGIETLRRQGMQVTTEVDTAAFQAALAPAYARFAQRFGQDAIDRIRNYQP